MSERLQAFFHCKPDWLWNLSFNSQLESTPGFHEDELLKCQAAHPGGLLDFAPVTHHVRKEADNIKEGRLSASVGTNENPEPPERLIDGSETPERTCLDAAEHLRRL